MKKYFLGLFCLLIITSSLFVGVNKVSALTLADIDMLVSLGIISPDKADAARATINGSVDSTSTQQTITVSSPTSGESLVEGTQYTIRWNTLGISSSQRLDITLNPNIGEGGTGKNIITGVPNTGSYLWKVKSLQPFYASEAGTWITPNGQYNIKVVCPISSSVCNHNNNFGTSGVFNIISATSTQSSITVLSPNGGETIKIGDKYNITWNSLLKFSSSRKIYLFLENPNNCSPMLVGCQNSFSIGSTGDTGKYVWDTNKKMGGSSTGPESVSITPGSQYKIKICRDEICDSSNNYFTISSATSTQSSVTATVTDVPTLRLTYGSNSSAFLSRKESLLTATFNVSVKAGSTDSKLYLNTADISFINNIGNSNQNVNSKLIVISNLQNLTEYADQYGRKYVTIPANTTASFKVVSTVKPSELFAGSYTANLNNLFNSDNSSDNNYQMIPVSGNNKTNSVTIVGETSPYITSVTPTLGVGDLMTVKGSRINENGTTARVYIDGDVISIGGSKGDGSTSIGFTLPNLTIGSHYIQISNASGMSNKFGFQVTTGSTIEQPSITISDPSGNQGLTVNVGDKFIISGTPKNLQGLKYWYGSGYPQGNYYNRAYFFDPIFNDSCSNNDASTDGVWSITCTAKISGVGKIYIEIYKDGKIYRSNDVVVTVNKNNNESSITVLSPNGGATVDVFKSFDVSFKTNNVYPAKHYINLVDESLDKSYSLDSLLGSDGITFTEQQIQQSEAQSITVSVPTSYDLKTSDKYKIEVCVNNKCDKSDNYFRISSTTSTQPSITVLSPNGGENLVMGKNQIIKWNKKSISLFGQKYDIKLIPYVACLYTNPACDLAVIPYTITKNLMGISYNWTVGSVLDKVTISNGPYTIQVCLVGTNTCDSSDSYFKIVDNTVSSCTYSYSTWGTCTNGTQTRTYTATPTRCTGTPVISQTCANTADISIVPTFVSSNIASDINAYVGGNSADVKTFKIVFNVRAIDGDVYVNKNGILWAVTNDSTQGVTNNGITSINASGYVSDDSSNNYKINDGETRTFTLAVKLTAIANGYTAIELKDIGWSLSDTSSVDKHYNFNLSNFKTSKVYMQRMTAVSTACTYTYTWGACTNGIQTATYTKTPIDCTGTPITSQPCTVVTPPVISDDKYCKPLRATWSSNCGSKSGQVKQGGVILEDGETIDLIKITQYTMDRTKWGPRIVTCPADSNYRVCVENANDGGGNYILLGVKAAQLNLNSLKTTASALESMKIEDVIQLLKLLKK